MMIVFVPSPQIKGAYDLMVNGRAREYDVSENDLAGAVHRARVDPDNVYVEDSGGHRTKFTRKRR